MVAKKKIVFIIIIIVVMLFTVLSFLSRHFFTDRVNETEILKIFSTFTEKPTLKTVFYEKYKVRYLNGGNKDKPTVMFIHGSPGSLSDYINYFKDTTLFSNSNLISVDRPGYGGSNPEMLVRSLEEQAKALNSVFENENITDSIILVGHSYGGPVAVKMALDYPEKIKGLLLISPALDPALETWKWYQKLAVSEFGRIIVPEQLIIAAEEIKSLKEQLTDLEPDYPNIEASTILMQGEKDKLVSKGNAVFAEKIMNPTKLKVELFPSENHFIPWTQKEAVIKNIMRLLSIEEKKKPEGN
ncbi:MAG: alpha/beta fold hydrolase [Hyphomicrobiales bacterium]